MGDHVSGKGLKRADLARRTGCNLETIRYYEKISMMPDPPRTASGYRVYDETHVGRLRFILRGRELGFSIEELRGLLQLVDRGTQTCAEVNRHLGEVRTVAAELGQSYLGIGYTPNWGLEDAPQMPKGRYRLMTDYMPTRGTRGLEMMYLTATVQVNLDFGSPAGMV